MCPEVNTVIPGLEEPRSGLENYPMPTPSISGIAGMMSPPGLNPLDVVAAPVMVPVLEHPASLTGSLTGTAAFGTGAVALVVGVMGLGQEPFVTTMAFAVAVSHERTSF